MRNDLLGLARIVVYAWGAFHALRFRDYWAWTVCMIFIVANIVTSYTFASLHGYGDIVRLAGALALVLYIVKRNPGRKK